MGKIWLKRQDTRGNQTSFKATGTEAHSSPHSILCNQSYPRENALSERREKKKDKEENERYGQRNKDDAKPLGNTSIFFFFTDITAGQD